MTWAGWRWTRPAIAAGALALAAWPIARLAEARAAGDIAAAARQRVGLYARSIEGTLDRYRSLPFVLADDHDVKALLDAPGTDAALAIDRKLDRINRAAGTAELFVMDRGGLTLAASNWQRPDSFVGANYRFRPYFIQALAKGAGHYYGIGVTTGQPGYFQAHAVAGPTVAGVVVAKIDLRPLEADWASGGEAVMVTDGNGVVFLSSRSDWRYGLLAPLPLDAQRELAATHQYEGVSLHALDLADAPGAPTDLRRVRLDGRRYLVASRPLPAEGWTVSYLADLAPAAAAARLAFAIAASAAAAVVLLVLYLRQRWLRLRAERAARDELERRVALRTADLRAAQQELVQAGKLAALGQMSAVMAHELNQPLAAMAMFLASGRVLAAQGDMAGLAANLDRIAGLAARMAKITGHLKAFARKGQGSPSAVPVRRAVDEALALTEGRLRQAAVEPVVDVPVAAVVRADPLRLEQVLINLIGNAVDAMAGRPDRRLEIACRPAAAGWAITVADSGPGVGPEALSRLFEPFFTTKPPGAGLGLGLSLSQRIVEEFGGTLAAANRPEGGAVFTVELAAGDG